MLTSVFKVVLDANVLFPAALCDLLLRAAAEDFYQVYWSATILDELERNLVRKLDLPKAAARRRVAQMKKYFPEAMVAEFEHLIPSMKNDEKDRHVVAAAVSVGAQTIVTGNLKDFRQRDLPKNLQAQSPDEFLLLLLSLRPRELIQMLVVQAEALRNPPLTLGDLIAGLGNLVPRFAHEARRLL